jgi:hypothetical protein
VSEISLESKEGNQMSTHHYYGGSRPTSTATRQTFADWLGCTAGQAAFSVALYVAGAFVELHRRYQQARAIRELSAMPDRLL